MVLLDYDFDEKEAAEEEVMAQNEHVSLSDVLRSPRVVPGKNLGRFRANRRKGMRTEQPDRRA
jgi:hypothetical protein